jgi:hypothetical protein
MKNYIHIARIQNGTESGDKRKFFVMEDLPLKQLYHHHDFIERIERE